MVSLLDTFIVISGFVLILIVLKQIVIKFKAAFELLPDSGVELVPKSLIQKQNLASNLICLGSLAEFNDAFLLLEDKVLPFLKNDLHLALLGLLLGGPLLLLYDLCGRSFLI